MKEIIFKYLQHTASEEEKKQLLEWLEADEENKKIFSGLRDTWLTEEKDHIFPPDYTQKAFSRFIQNIEAESRQHKTYLFPALLKIAVAITLLFVCSAGGYWLRKYQEQDSREMIVMNQVMMGKDSKGSVTLPDSTVVWLNAGSKLIYPDKFSDQTRKVSLEGEGYFEVFKNEAAPFYVETRDMTVRVLGTHFDVKNYAAKKTWETTLLSGKVEIYFPDTKRTVVMEPNQKMVCARGSNRYQLKEVNASEYILWINDKLVFTNESLSFILHQLERWYGIDIVCKGDIPLTQRLSLTIRKESPEEIFKLLELISPIRYKIEEDKIYVRHK